MKKSIVSLVLALSLFVPFTAHAQDYATVKINGTIQNYDQPPVVVNNRTLVPLRGIFESLGATVSWDQSTQTAKAIKDNITITLQIGSNTAYKNSQPVTLDVPAQLVNDRTMVPVRFISESFGADVEWDQNSHTVMVSTPKLSVEEIGRLSDRVVYIEVSDSTGKVFASGSGFVVSNDGKIITNYHVIKDAASAKIYFSNQKTYTTTTLLDTDQVNDLALLKIDVTDLPTVSLGDSSNLALGESVVAIGSPIGFRNTLSTGVVSSPSRTIDGRDFIQISTPIDHGSSGGALFNMRGEVVGVTSNGYQSSADINLAIPSNIVKEFLKRPQTPTKMVGQQAVNFDGLKTYLNNNFGVPNFKGYTFHFHYEVFQRPDIKGSPSIAIAMSNPDEVGTLLNLQKNDQTVIPSLLLSVSEKSHEVVNGNPFIGLWFVYGSNQMESIAFSEYNFDTGIFSYSVLDAPIQSINMN